MVSGATFYGHKINAMPFGHRQATLPGVGLRGIISFESVSFSFLVTRLRKILEIAGKRRQAEEFQAWEDTPLVRHGNRERGCER